MAKKTEMKAKVVKKAKPAPKAKAVKKAAPAKKAKPAKKSKAVKKADMGLIGLAVMGENLVLNMESKGYTVACFNRTVSKVEAFVEGRAAGKNIIGCKNLKELAASLLNRLSRRSAGPFEAVDCSSIPQ